MNIPGRNENCEKCSRFSHCNNNDLICRGRYLSIYYQLQREQQRAIKMSKALEDIKNYCEKFNYCMPPLAHKEIIKRIGEVTKNEKTRG